MTRLRVPRIAACLTAAIALLATAPAHALRVTTWNVLAFEPTSPGDDVPARQPAFRTVLGALSTDILVTEEMLSQTGADTMLAMLKAAQPTGHVWKESYIQTTQCAVYWDSLAVLVTNLTSFTDGGPRPVLVCLIKPTGYLTNAGWFRLYGMHLKAGQNAPGSTDSTTRRVECTNIRNTLNGTNQVVVGPNFILCGDTNFYGAYEGGYIRLTESQSNNNGRSTDRLGATMTGDWHVQGQYAVYDTQSPCASCFDPALFSGGGMDDRFDILFTSASLQDAAGLDVIDYFAYGNDGNHFNTDINAGGFNTAVGITVANALHDASDHLPVIMTLQLPPLVGAASYVDFGPVIVGGTATQTLTVSNRAPTPAAVLHYSLSAPAGFSAPGGSFMASAGVAGNDHAVGLDTSSPGVRNGTLSIASDDPDSLSRPVQLTSTVLRHAVASLDSQSVVLSDTLDFGAHAPGGFDDHAAAVYDQGFDALQARLSLQTAAIGGGGGRFSVVGFAPALVAGMPAHVTVHFDATLATPDSSYLATLTLGSSDEPLPGAAPQPDLTVVLKATLPSSTGVPGAGHALRFAAPRPNPFAEATRFAFELPEAAPIRLEIFDLSGRHVRTLAAGEQAAGVHTVVWDGTDERGVRVTGLFFARFRTAGLERTVRLVAVR